MSLKRVSPCLAVVMLAALWAVKKPVGADDWQPIDPADLKMTSEPKAPGAPVIYLYRQVDRSDSGNVTSEFNYARIKILTEDGRKYGDVEVPFDKGNENVAGIRARTIHPDGDLFMVPKETYPVLRNFYQAVRTGDEEQVVLQPSGTAARN